MRLTCDPLATMANQGADTKTLVGASISRTGTKVIKFNHIWIIDNFDFHLTKRVVRSPKFSAEANDGIEWYLKLYPDGETKQDKGYVSVFLYLRKKSPSGVLANYRIRILSTVQVPLGELPCCKPLTFTPGSSSGHGKFIKQQDLLADQQKYLPNHELILRCEVWYALDEGGGSKSPLHPQVPESILEELLTRQAFSDVVLTVNGKEFKAHRAILSARSPVFKAMFDRDPTPVKTSRIEISGMDEATFVGLLRFIYTGEAENADNAANLLAIIDKHAKPV